MGTYVARISHAFLWRPSDAVLTQEVSRMTPTPREPLAPLLTRKQAAALLRVSTKTIYNLGRTGQIQEVRIGRIVRYDQADILKLTAAAKGGRNG